MGYFRTNFVKYHTFPVYTHPAYTNPHLLGNMVRTMLGGPSVVKGDPDKVAKRLYELANLADPPLHLQLGHDAQALLKAKLERDAAEREKYVSWSEDLNF